MDNPPKQLEMPLFEVRIELSKTSEKAGQYFAIVSPIDADLANSNWHVNIFPRTNYAIQNVRLGVNSRTCRKMHRVILARKLERDLLSTEQVDHINGNGLDNRRENLRVATKAQNVRNRKLSLTNTSGYKGVSWDKKSKKWKAQIQANGIKKHLGFFDTPEAAHQAYCGAADRLHGKFANYGDE